MKTLIVLLGALLWTKLAQAQSPSPWPHSVENGATTDGIYGSTRLDDWPPGLAQRARAMHEDFCRRLGQFVQFEPFNGHGCAKYQEGFLRNFCGAQGQSLRRRSASSCLPEVQHDLNWWLGELASEMPPRAAPRPVAPAAPPSAMVSTRVTPTPALPPGGSLFAVPASIEGMDLPPPTIFSQSQQAVWILQGPVAQGSAVAVSPRHLLTTCHVLKGSIEGIVEQRGVRHRVMLLTGDVASDRCILQVAEPVLQPVLGMRRYSDIVVGERTFAIGAPFGLELTLTEGLVSSLRIVDGVPVVQTSAPISPGSSGGALLDAKGNLLGVTAFNRRGGQALGFAIAADSFWELR